MFRYLIELIENSNNVYDLYTRIIAVTLVIFVADIICFIFVWIICAKVDTTTVVICSFSIVLWLHFFWGGLVGYHGRVSSFVYCRVFYLV